MSTTCRMRWPPRVLRALAATTTLGVGLVIVQSSSEAAAGAPSVFDVSVVATPVVDDLALITVLPLPLDNGIARSSVSMNSQPLVIAQAAVVYAPLGETLTAAQPEASGAAWCFSYFPSGPGNPAESRCGGGGAVPEGLPVEAGSGHTATTGDANDPTTLHSRASTKATGIGGAGFPAPISTGSASSSAESKAVDERMTAAGATFVGDIEVAGVLRIRSVSAFVTAALSGEPDGAAVERDLVIEGATVAGQPVEIDETGVHAVGQPPVPLVDEDQQAQINEALAAAGITVAVAPAADPEINADGTEMRASSGSLQIEFNNFETGIISRINIGTVAVVMHAARPIDPSATLPLATDVVPVAARPTSGPPPTPPAAGGLAASAPPPPPAPGEGAGNPTREVSVAAIQRVSDAWDLPYSRYAALVLALPFLLTIRRLSITRR